jgi:phospholipase C
MGSASDPGFSRRQVIKGAASIGAGLSMTSWASALVEKAYAADPAGTGGLGDIEHFVFLMQENRSFDHYFGSLSGVRGFNDPNVLTQTVNGKTYPVFNQFGYEPGVGVTANGYTEPFRLFINTKNPGGEVINDPTHDWGPQHDCWNNGAMDQFVTTHIASDGDKNGPVVMGYYTRAELPFHYALADAFTICDSYFCSVIGPTYPNRLYWMSGTIDPSGQNGGPLLETLSPVSDIADYGKFTWPTMPELLEEAGVSWKVYQSPDTIEGVESPILIDNVLRYFKAYTDNPLSALSEKALLPIFPTDFQTDVASGNLPQVSWIVTQFLECEHPAAPPAWGAVALAQTLSTLVSNRDVWEKTALIISYDEQGGFFDHVAPPTAPPGTPDEYITVSPLSSVANSDGIAGPIGLGFRVPCLILSPYARGGLCCRDVLDHTSQLRLLETKFGIPVPNLSSWRRGVTGDLTGAFNFASPAKNTVPPLPKTTLFNKSVDVDVADNILLASEGQGIPYPVPANTTPHQEPGPPRPSPSGL